MYSGLKSMILLPLHALLGVLCRSRARSVVSSPSQVTINTLRRTDQSLLQRSVAPRLLALLVLVLGGCGDDEPQVLDLRASGAPPDLAVPAPSCVEGATCQVANACQSGAITCGVAGPTCRSAAPMPDGTSCGAGSICQAGECAACAEGMGCVPTSAPCHKGTLTCKSRPECVDSGAQALDGTSCGANQVCKAGACTACVAGRSCAVPGNPCHTGVTACDTGSEVCLDKGQNAPNGTGCEKDKVCSAGSCVTCVVGKSCIPAGNACHSGVTTCDTGIETCVDQGALMQNGTACGQDKVCSGGTCVACQAGAACTSASPCKAAVISCTTGAAVCQDSGNKPEGADCGGGKVCSAGACVACQAGMSCAPANPCHSGALSCINGTQTCADTGNNVANGAACGQDKVCFQGGCVACKAGDACTPANACHTGVTSCASGQRTCVDTGTVLAAGSACGQSQVCSAAGSCVFCQAGGSCSLNNPCKVAAYSCASGQQVCAETANQQNGASCGFNQVCFNGSCGACQAGKACAPPNPCKLGATSCISGQETCAESGADVANGTGCGNAKVCNAGACTSFTMVVESGDAQTSYIDQVLTPVVVRLRDANNAAVVGVTVTFSAPPGAVATTPGAVTNSLGRATAALRLGRATGAYSFTASALGLTTAITATATEPPAGTEFTLINAGRSSGSAGVPGAGTAALASGPGGVAVASDGTVYVSDTSNNRVLKLNPNGTIVTLAGTGQSGFFGDGGLATAAKLSYPWSLALDEANKLLYISDVNNSRIRMVDLAVGVIDTVAGGGNAPGPGYGDGDVATNASINVSYSQISVGPDGNVYFGDVSANRIRRVNMTTGVITTFLGTGSCVAKGPPQLQNCQNGGCGVAFDKLGSLFVSGYLCDGSLSAYGILRRSSAGVLSRVAGSSASTISNVSALASPIDPGAHLAFDGAGNLYTTESSKHRIRKIESGSGRITMITGDGTQGDGADYSAALGNRIYYPYGLAFDGKNNLYFVDYGTNTLRAIWGAGSATATAVTLTASLGKTRTTEVLNLAQIGARLVDSAGVALQGYPIQFKALQEGLAVYDSLTLTDAGGQAKTFVRAGLPVANYGVEASYLDIHGAAVSGSPAAFAITSTAPAAGTLMTAVNTSHGSGNTGVPGPGTLVQMGAPWAVAAASDGSVYYSDSSYRKIYRLLPTGRVVHVAGGGVGGDGGAADQADLGNVESIALDESKNLLYVATYKLIRVIDLGANKINAFAGGGNAPGPGYGDGGPASAADFYLIYMAVGPDKAVYLGDYNSGRIRRVETAGGNVGIITAWLTPAVGSSCSDPLSLYSRFLSGSNLPTALVWDKAGNAFFVIDACGTTVSPNGNNAKTIIRRATNGALTRYAGRYQGVTTEAALATDALLKAPRGLTIDANDNIYYSDYDDHRVRRIDAATGKVYTVAGTGVAGNGVDYGPGDMTQLNGPVGLAAMAGGHLVFADYNNYCIRILW